MLSPKPTTELNKLATIQVDSSTPIRLYFRSADLLIKQARVYKAEGDFQHAYVLYMKYTNLGLSELPKHASYRNNDNKKSIRVVNQNCLEALDALENMKPMLNEQYQKYVDRMRAQEKAKEAAIAEQHAIQLRGPQDKAAHPENIQDWSLQDALKGVAGVGYGDDNRKQQSPGILHAHYPDASFQNLSDGYKYAPSHIDGPTSTLTRPLLPPKPSFDRLHMPREPIAEVRDISGPPLPPKPQFEKEVIILEPGPLSEGTLHALFCILGTKLAVYDEATTEKGEPLRIINVPKSLQKVFLEIARTNTQKNIETCGILAGKLKLQRNNILTVTTLIIPKQTGTSDTCTTENEEELFEFQDKYDLLTFGWIHTHPTQSCFLSSVDLHTHCSYQLMLPEAIAIVCAPKHNPSFGIFRMTDPPGLDVISTCTAERAFHPHPDLPIYTASIFTTHKLKLTIVVGYKRRTRSHKGLRYQS
ncbi:hypothetical protein DFQ30_006459 [Apophysomyces sp. BC1015]|nr:hypothetical protein DFQ30_006459 [Apophysomyces sp. BC1015]